MITLEIQEKPLVICIMTTHGESWRPTGGSPRRERVKSLLIKLRFFGAFPL